MSTVSLEYLEKTLKGAKYNKLPLFGNKKNWFDLIEAVEETADAVKWAEEVSSFPREWMYYMKTLEEQYAKVQNTFRMVGIIIPKYHSEAELWCNLRKIATFNGKIEAMKKIA